MSGEETKPSVQSTPSGAMLRLLFGHRVTRAIDAALKLGLIDTLGDSTQSLAALAQTSGAHEPSLLRLLRFLVSIGVLAEPDRDSFTLTSMGMTLRPDVVGSVRAVADLQLDQRHFDAWDDLLNSVTTGGSAFEHVFGKDVWAYRAEHLDYSQTFDAAMAALMNQLTKSLVASYDFSSLSHIIDVGGGNGALMSAILQANPSLRGTIFDLPHVVSGAKERIEAAGLADRAAMVAGNFFESVPNGGDAYLLSRIIHDWNDERSIAILSTVRRAMPAHSNLLLIEGVVPDPVREAPRDQDILLTDMTMLVMTGGRERTAAEYSTLFAAAGLKLNRVIPTQSPTSIIEAVPV